MTKACCLPRPHLNARLCGARSLSLFTDDGLYACVGVRVAFTGCSGGVSAPPFLSLNLGDHVGDDPQAVASNRFILLESLGASHLPLIHANQVHGEEIVELYASDAVAVEEAQAAALLGADALVLGTPNVAALLCFADCVPVIVVSPTGRFAVVHAGWRGAVAGIVGKAVGVLAKADFAWMKECDPSAYNAYIGPHIRGECFQTGEEVYARFVERFGKEVAFDQQRISLASAVSLDLLQAGLCVERIVDAGVCTRCETSGYFSYRASGGVCGRQGALALRLKGERHGC